MSCLFKVTSYPSVKTCIRHSKYQSVNSYSYVNAESLFILRINRGGVNKLCEQNAVNVGVTVGSPYSGRWAFKVFSCPYSGRWAFKEFIYVSFCLSVCLSVCSKSLPTVKWPTLNTNSTAQRFFSGVKTRRRAMLLFPVERKRTR